MTVDQVSSVVVAVSAAFAVYVAWAGLKAWREQLRGRTEYELARRLLRSVYRVRDEIGSVRQPFIPVGEMATAAEAAGLDLTDDPNGIDDFRVDQAVYSRRTKQLDETLSDLQLEEAEAEVLWGEPAKSAIQPVNTAVRDLRRALWEVVDRKANPQRYRNESHERVDRRTAILYAGSSDSDAFAAELKSAVEAAEEFLQPHLSLRNPVRRFRKAS